MISFRETASRSEGAGLLTLFDMEATESTSVLVGLVGVLALVLANAFFVAAEFALVGARKTRLDEMSRAGDRKATLARRAIQSLDKYISATQLGITLASLGLGWIGKPALASLFEGVFALFGTSVPPVTIHTVAIAAAFTIISVLHIVLGELMPKAVALLYPEDVSRWTAAPLMAFGWAMTGPIKLLNGSSNALLRALGVKSPGEHERLHSPEEIRMLVEQSEEGGRMDQDNARLLEGVFEFTEKAAQDVMTPRTEIVALEAGLSVEQASDIVAAAGRSRYPVHLDSLDEIVGIVHAKDILRTLRADPATSIRTIGRPPHLVPGTRQVEDVLADMKRLKVHMAIVIDEYGGTAGLVTMEDLLEEIVGEIFDEHDPVEPPATADGALLLEGAMTIAEFNASQDTQLDDSDYTTLGGFLFGQLGRLPAAGDRVITAGMTFEITAMDGRRVRTVQLVERTAKPASRQ